MVTVQPSVILLSTVVLPLATVQSTLEPMWSAWLVTVRLSSDRDGTTALHVPAGQSMRMRSYTTRGQGRQAESSGTAESEREKTVADRVYCPTVEGRG